MVLEIVRVLVVSVVLAAMLGGFETLARRRGWMARGRFTTAAVRVASWVAVTVGYYLLADVQPTKDGLILSVDDRLPWLGECPAAVAYWFRNVLLTYVALLVIVAVARSWARGHPHWLRDADWGEAGGELAVFLPLFMAAWSFPNYTWSLLASLDFHQGLPCVCAQHPAADRAWFLLLRSRDATIEFSLYVIGTNLVLLSGAALHWWWCRRQGRPVQDDVQGFWPPASECTNAKRSLLTLVLLVLGNLAYDPGLLAVVEPAMFSGWWVIANVFWSGGLAVAALLVLTAVEEAPVVASTRPG